MNRHPIKVVAARTGLSPHLIRMWERRYGAVMPARTQTNRRLYSDEDISRLALLRKATQAGESIGQIAKLDQEELRQLTNLPPGGIKAGTDGQVGEARAALHVEQCLHAIRRSDQGALESELLKADVALGVQATLDEVLNPLLVHVGQMWHEGRLGISHEHLVSAVVRTFLGNVVGSSLLDAEAPVMLSTTPTGAMHEFGALMVSATAAARGWRAVYAGPNTPAADIATGAKINGARLVALSLIFPPGDPEIRRQLIQTRQLLDDKVTLVVGGRSAESYRDTLDEQGIRIIRDLRDLADYLSAGMRPLTS